MPARHRQPPSHPATQPAMRAHSPIPIQLTRGHRQAGIDPHPQASKGRLVDAGSSTPASPHLPALFKLLCAACKPMAPNHMPCALALAHLLLGASHRPRNWHWSASANHPSTGLSLLPPSQAAHHSGSLCGYWAGAAHGPLGHTHAFARVEVGSKNPIPMPSQVGKVFRPVCVVLEGAPAVSDVPPPRCCPAGAALHGNYAAGHSVSDGQMRL